MKAKIDSKLGKPFKGRWRIFRLCWFNDQWDWKSQRVQRKRFKKVPLDFIEKGP